MNVGDPKKAIVLAIIAVMVVSVAVFRMVPSGGSQIPAAATLINRPKDSSDVAKVPVVEPDQLKVDSFSHPNLNKEPKQAATAPQPIAKKPRSSVRDDWDAGNEPVRIGPEPLGSQGDSKSGSGLPEPKPDENTGSSQQLKGGTVPGLTLRLDAVVRSGEAMALVSVAHGASSPCHVGSSLNGHIKVIKIMESSIVIQSSGKRIEIAVGEEVAL